MFLPLPPVSWRQFHPILVHFSAALVPVSFASDALARAFRNRPLSDAAWWTLVVAAAVTPFTAATGWWLRLSMRHVAQDDAPLMAFHQWIGSALVVVFIGLCAWRWTIHHKQAAPGWRYLLCGALVLLLTAYQGHLCGAL